MTATIRHSYIRPETHEPSVRNQRAHRASSRSASGDAVAFAVVGRQPNYAARRMIAMFVAVAAVAVAALVAATLVGVATETVASAGGQPAVASGVGDQAVSPAIHLVQPGETLWTIADRYRGEVGQVRFVDALIDLNGGTVIQPGQTLRLP